MARYLVQVPLLRDEPHFTFIDDPLPWDSCYPKKEKNAEGKYVRVPVRHGAVHCYKFALPAGEKTCTFGCDQPRLFVWHTSGELKTRGSDDGRVYQRRVAAGAYHLDDHRFHGTMENMGDSDIEALVVCFSAVDAFLSPVNTGYQVTGLL